MTDVPNGPLDADAVLEWMSLHPDRLLGLLSEEGATDDEPAGDAAVRAHLRFAAEGLPYGGEPQLAAALEGFAGALPDWFEADRGTLEHQLELGVGAIALEKHLLFDATDEDDPRLHAALERRVRLGAWNRIWLRGLEDWLGSAFDGMADDALAWTMTRNRDLALLILTLDRAMKDGMTRARGTAPTREESDDIGQVAAVQGYARQAIEAAAHALATS